MALKDTWIDKKDKTATQPGDKVLAKDINNIAHAVMDNEKNITSNTFNITQQGEDIEELKKRIGTARTYGVNIDLTNSNPETAVTYTFDAAGMTPGSPDWDKEPLFKDIKPCLFNHGEVVGYLNKNNFAEFEDGSPAEITTGSMGDVMIEIPKLGYKIEISGNTLVVQVTTEEYKPGFSYLAHTRQDEGDRDKLYIGAFLSYSPNNEEHYSIAGVLPTQAKALNDFRAAAHNKWVGGGYDVIAFYQVVLIQCLFLIKYKTLDSQSVLDYGFMGSPNEEDYLTGTTIRSGMDKTYHSTSYEHVKFLGIEDLWGNLESWVEGGKTNGYYEFEVATDDFSNWESYTKILKMYPSAVYNQHMQRPFGTNEMGFLFNPSFTGGSSSTYFCDACTLTVSARLRIGMANPDMPTAGGIFNVIFSGGGTLAVDGIGARLMYL